MLARGVHRTGSGVQTGDACGIDDVAFTLIDEDRQKSSDPVDHAPEIDAQDPTPRRERTEPGVGTAGYPSVVAHDMHRPKPLHSGIRQRLNCVMVADVGGYGQRLHTQRPDAVGGARQSPFFYIRQNHVKAVVREPLG